MKKRVTAVMMAGVMAASMLAGCSTENSSETTAAAPETTAEVVSSDAAETETAGESAGEGNTELSGTLKMYGPGLFAEVGQDGTMDMITGVEKPGYQVVMDRWKELYPNVELEIEAIPWDNWKAALQTAAISGDVDILLHGASLGPVVEPLQPYLDQDPELEDQLTMLTLRRNAELAPLNEVVPYGITVTLNPVMVVINKTIFEDYGVEIPDYKTWTLDDLMEAAKATTGTDPKTGKQTYGISPIKASDAFKNYIWVSRAMNNEIFEWGDSIATSKMNFVSDKTAEVLDYIAEFNNYASPDYVEGLDLSSAWTEDHNIAMVVVENPYNVYNTLKANGLDD